MSCLAAAEAGHAEAPGVETTDETDSERETGREICLQPRKSNTHLKMGGGEGDIFAGARGAGWMFATSDARVGWVDFCPRARDCFR